MATLYVRNLPSELYAELQRWAADAGRSVNAEVLDLLEREAASRKQRAEWWQKLQALRDQIRPLSGPPWPEDLIREDRDHGHRPDQGF
jgi:plasmid stability protein